MYLKDILAIATDVITIIGLIWAVLFGFLKKYKSVIGFKVNQFIISMFKLSWIAFFGIIIFQFSTLIYNFTLVITKGTSNGELWEKGFEFEHVLAYFITIGIGLAVWRFFILVIWNGPFVYFKQILKEGKLSLISTKFDFQNKLDIINAVYKSERKSIDVTYILKSMIANNKLTITASNSLVGDPEWGVEKELVIKYRFGNGDIKILTIREKDTDTIEYGQ